jgi:hypothetical protein
MFQTSWELLEMAISKPVFIAYIHLNKNKNLIYDKL